VEKPASRAGGHAPCSSRPAPPRRRRLGVPQRAEAGLGLGFVGGGGHRMRSPAEHAIEAETRT
jgi:hypothetical protein